MLIQKHALPGQPSFFIQKAREQIENYPEELALPRVVVGGCLNTGKTTLVNGLLKNDSPITFNTPCPVFFTYGTQFTAKLWENGRSLFVSNPRELTYLLKTKNERKRPEKVEVTVNHSLLKLGQLVDTPGIDSPAWFQFPGLEQIFAGAGQIVYLFHQRGIQLYDRQFLQRLKELLGQNSYKALSFWLNGNAGRPDGTSLASTKAALRELFGAEIPVHPLNTNDQDSIGTLSIFLQERLLTDLFSQIEERLRQEDALLPQMLAESLSLAGEDAFLLSFWTVKAKAMQILVQQQQIDELRKQKTGKAVLAENKRRNLPPEAPRPRPNGPETTVPKAAATPAPFPLPRPNCPESPGSGPEADRPQPFFSGSPEHRQIGKGVGQFSPEQSFGGSPGLPGCQFRSASPGKFVVAAWGPFSSGKTTFFNALLQAPLLPAEDKPTTSYLTRLHYGPEKIAVVHFLRQFTFPLTDWRKGKLKLRYQEINTLEHFLARKESGREITGIEVACQGRYRKVTQAELLRRLAQTKSLFAPGQKTDFQNSAAITAVRLTFPGDARRIYHLEREQEEFRQMLTGPLNFLIATVDVYFPGEFLKLATFVDPPGIDAVFAQHRQICLQALAGAGLLLVFIHGKQLVPTSYQQELRENIAGRAGHLARAGRVLFLINFADTLAAPERERAANFVRRQLATFIPDPPFFFISSLAALHGHDGGTGKVLRRIQEIISAREKEVF